MTGLARRIQAITERPQAHAARPAVLLLTLTALAASTVALPDSVRDRRVTLEQAQQLAATARAGSSFPIVVNERVLHELNRLLGTPDGRKFMREGLQRMRAHEGMIRRALEQHDLPSELLAVPLVESGYRNITQGPKAAHGAGIWMFIKPTARAFGLTVNDAKDERLDVARETHAAMRYFTELHGELEDWNLALLAYNCGTGKVKRGIRETGRRDAFHLIEHGFENDPGYLPRVMAAILVLKNAHLLERE